MNLIVEESEEEVDQLLEDVDEEEAIEEEEEEEELIDYDDVELELSNQPSNLTDPEVDFEQNENGNSSNSIEDESLAAFFHRIDKSIADDMSVATTASMRKKRTLSMRDDKSTDAAHDEDNTDEEEAPKLKRSALQLLALTN